MSSLIGDSSAPRKSSRVRQKRSLGDDFVDPTKMSLSELTDRGPSAKKKSISHNSVPSHISNASSAVITEKTSTSKTKSINHSLLLNHVSELSMAAEKTRPVKRKSISQSPAPGQHSDDTPTPSSLVLKAIADHVTNGIVHDLQKEIKEEKEQAEQEALKVSAQNVNISKSAGSSTKQSLLQLTVQKIKERKVKIEDEDDETSYRTEQKQTITKVQVPPSRPVHLNSSQHVVHQLPRGNDSMHDPGPPRNAARALPCLAVTRNQYNHKLSTAAESATMLSRLSQEEERRLDNEAAAQVAAIREANVKKILEKRSLGKISTGGQAAAQDAEIFQYVTKTTDVALLNKLPDSRKRDNPQMHSSGNAPKFVQLRDRTIAVPPTHQPRYPTTLSRIAPAPLRCDVQSQPHLYVPAKFPVRTSVTMSKAPISLPGASVPVALKKPKNEIDEPKKKSEGLKEPKEEPQEERKPVVEKEPLKEKKPEHLLNSRSPTPTPAATARFFSSDNVTIINNHSAQKCGPGQQPVYTRTVTIMPQSRNKNGSPQGPCSFAMGTQKQVARTGQGNQPPTGRPLKKFLITRDRNGRILSTRPLFIINPPSQPPNHRPPPVARPLTAFERYQRGQTNNVNFPKLPENVVSARNVRRSSHVVDSVYTLASKQKLKLHPNQPQIIIPIKAREEVEKEVEQLEEVAEEVEEYEEVQKGMKQVRKGEKEKEQVEQVLKEVKAEQIEVKEEPLDDYEPAAVKEEPMDDYEPDSVAPNKTVRLFPVAVVPRHTNNIMDTRSMARYQRKLKKVSLYDSIMRGNRSPSPHRVFLGAEEPMKEDNSPEFNRYTLKQVDSFNLKHLEPFGKIPVSSMFDEPIPKRQQGMSAVLLAETNLEKVEEDAKLYKAQNLEEVWHKKKIKDAEYIRQKEALAQKININPIKIWEYMQSDEFKTTVEPTMGISQFEKVLTVPDALAKIPEFSDSLFHTNPTLFKNLHRIHRMRIDDDFQATHPYPHQTSRQVDVADGKVSGPVKVVLGQQKLSPDEIMKKLTSDKASLIEVFWNGITTKVPEVIKCHLCDDTMRLCMRKSNYRGELRRYPAYRCLRKGCQTFRSIKKQFDMNLRRGEGVGHWSLESAVVTEEPSTSAKPEPLDDYESSVTPDAELNLRQRSRSSTAKRSLSKAPKEEPKTPEPMDDVVPCGVVTRSKRARKSKLDHLSVDYYCGSSAAEIAQKDEEEEEDDEDLGETVDFEYITAQSKSTTPSEEDEEFEDDLSDYEESRSPSPDDSFEEMSKVVSRKSSGGKMMEAQTSSESSHVRRSTRINPVSKQHNDLKEEEYKLEVEEGDEGSMEDWKPSRLLRK